MSAFESLVRPALVRIAAPGDGYDPLGDRYWGTGFFIAPGWVLTCAHVVAKGGSAVWKGERAVGIVWDGGVTTGEVVLASPRPAEPEQRLDRWDFPDLALVRVPDARDASCVRLSERAPVIAEPIPVALHGWSRVTGRLAIREALGQVHGVDGGALLLSGTQPVEGLSGGPVVDLNRAVVIGLNKGRGADEGAAVPITSLQWLRRERGGEVLSEVMRDHDRHHLARYHSLSDEADWTRAQLHHRPPTAQGLDPGRRIDLYGRLAELPPPTGPGDVLHLVDEARRLTVGHDLRPVLEVAPQTWREGVGLLHELHEPDQESAADLGPNAVFVYAAKVARHVRERHGDSVALRSLATWVTEAATEMPLRTRKAIAGALAVGRAAADGRPTGGGPVREPGARADVLIEIDPPRYGRKFPWQVKLLFDGRTITPLHGDDEGVERERLRDTLREPLADALARGDRGEHLAAVEALLPRELFDEPLDTWRLSPDDELFDERSLPLGHRRIVVIRDAGRRTRAPAPEWHRRWRTAGIGPLRAVPLRAEVLAARRDLHAAHRIRRESPRQAWVRLSEAADGSVPVYCGPVGSGDGLKAMAAALAAGHPIALWRTGAHDHDHAACVEFHERADRLLAEAGRAEGLHGPVLSLRRRVAMDMDLADMPLDLDLDLDPGLDPDPYFDEDPAFDPALDPAFDPAFGPDGSEHAWATNLAVLFDPPDRPPHEDPLQGPPMLGEEEW
ncbi:trypsin-like peptidase domain-containing protein [Streptomyces sp. P9(2023)]|uniref:VMAP-C domain-containing protein n=1 Tax=Streptomyces sp. P9(2023) TaxID=3064394 RepID=UPI0028F40805|nr:trypsin-like peptidase domain-containing protein [Streptomyces sp. P9(2023)]MDT9688134.1 trypsin-like peptidase domain-containing protein [Streptomyces sp. P9(2023)]